MIAEINKAYQPALVLLYGVKTLVNGGPEAGKQVKSNVILAGIDRVAVNVVKIGILQALGTAEAVSCGSGWQLKQIRRAVELDLGAAHSDQIEMMTPNATSRSMVDHVRD